MGYGEGYAFFERLRRLVAEATGLESIRADDIPTSADDREFHGHGDDGIPR